MARVASLPKVLSIVELDSTLSVDYPLTMKNPEVTWISGRMIFLTVSRSLEMVMFLKDTIELVSIKNP